MFGATMAAATVAVNDTSYSACSYSRLQMEVSLSDLIAKREALDRQIKSAQDADRSAAIAQIRTLMADHGLTRDDIAANTSSKAARKGGMKPGTKVAPKFRDPSSGASWTGRGLRPKWLSAAIAEGRRLEEFAI